MSDLDEEIAYLERLQKIEAKFHGVEDAQQSGPRDEVGCRLLHFSVDGTTYSMRCSTEGVLAAELGNRIDDEDYQVVAANIIMQALARGKQPPRRMFFYSEGKERRADEQNVYVRDGNFELD